MKDIQAGIVGIIMNGQAVQEKQGKCFYKNIHLHVCMWKVCAVHYLIYVLYILFFC